MARASVKRSRNDGMVGMNDVDVVVMCTLLSSEYTIAGSHWESIIQV